MKRAEWAGAVLAESDDIVMVEGNAYFPQAVIRREHFVPSDKTTFCPWKGTTNYYSVRVDNQTNGNAAWYYAEPKAAASRSPAASRFGAASPYATSSASAFLAREMHPVIGVCADAA